MPLRSLCRLLIIGGAVLVLTAATLSLARRAPGTTAWLVASAVDPARRDISLYRFLYPEMRLYERRALSGVDAVLTQWSADGAWLYFLDGTGLIWRWQPTGASATPVRVGALGEGFALSPGLRWIAGPIRQAEGVGLWVMAGDGSLPPPLSPFTARWIGRLAWSPDGEWVAFAAQAHEGARQTDLYRLRAADGVVERLTATPESEHDPAWTPDGQALIFRRLEGDKETSSVLQMPAGGGAPAYLNEVLVWSRYEAPVFAPDGGAALLVANAVARGLPRIFRMQADGRSLVDLATGIHPRWSPDGQRVVFLRRDGTYQLAAVGRNGGQVHALAPGFTIEAFAWAAVEEKSWAGPAWVVVGALVMGGAVWAVRR